MGQLQSDLQSGPVEDLLPVQVTGYRLRVTGYGLQTVLSHVQGSPTEPKARSYGVPDSEDDMPPKYAPLSTLCLDFNKRYIMYGDNS